MKFKNALNSGLLAGALLLGAPLAQAHAVLKSTTPADGATVAAVPEQLELQFSSPLYLTYVALTPNGHKTPTALELPERQAKSNHTLPLPALSANHYAVEWRSMSGDGHVMKGTFGFTVAAE